MQFPVIDQIHLILSDNVTTSPIIITAGGFIDSLSIFALILLKLPIIIF